MGIRGIKHFIWKKSLDNSSKNKDSDVSSLYRGEYYSIENMVAKVNHSFEDFIIDKEQFIGTLEKGKTDGSVTFMLKEPLRICKITTKSDETLKVLVQSSSDGHHYEVKDVFDQNGTWAAKSCHKYWKIVIKMSIKDDEDEEKIIKVSFSLFVKKLYSDEEISGDKIETGPQALMDNVLKAKKKVTFDLENRQINSIKNDPPKPIEVKNGGKPRKKSKEIIVFKIDHVERNPVISAIKASLLLER